MYADDIRAQITPMRLSTRIAHIRQMRRNGQMTISEAIRVLRGKTTESVETRTMATIEDGLFELLKSGETDFTYNGHNFRYRAVSDETSTTYSLRWN